jgi:hypothetical protein
MRHEQAIAMLALQRMEGEHAADHRRGQEARHAVPARGVDLLPHRPRWPHRLGR